VAGLGGVGDRDGAVASGQAHHQRLGFRTGIRRQPGNIGTHHGLDRRRRRGFLHPGQHCFGKGGKTPRHILGIGARQAAHLPGEIAAIGQDVARDAAMEFADMHGVIGWIEATAGVELTFALVGDPDQLGRQSHTGVDSTRAEMRLRGVRGEAGDRGEEGADALMRVGKFERGRLADDDGARARQVLPIWAMPSTTPRQVTSSS
jgi:hypothetical protein